MKVNDLEVVIFKVLLTFAQLSATPESDSVRELSIGLYLKGKNKLIEYRKKGINGVQKHCVMLCNL